MNTVSPAKCSSELSEVTIDRLGKAFNKGSKLLQIRISEADHQSLVEVNGAERSTYPAAL